MSKKPTKSKKQITEEAALALLKAGQKELVIFDVEQQRVEYWDDRFYKVTLTGQNIGQYLRQIPADYIRSFANGKYEVYLPSVTTIYGNTKVNEFLSTWRGNVGNMQADYISKTALRKGSNVHNALEELCLGAEIVYINLNNKETPESYIIKQAIPSEKPLHFLMDQSEMVQVARFKRLMDIVNPVIVNTEQTVYSLAECYAGTLDQVWQVKGGSYDVNPTRNGAIRLEDGFYIVDFKSGKGIDEEGLFCQLAAYHYAHPSTHEIKGALGIHLNNDNKRGIEGIKVYHKTADELQRYFRIFCNLKTVFFDKPIYPVLYDIPKNISLNLNRKEEKNGTA